MIIVDESDPIEELVPQFPYRDVTIRRGVRIREDYELQGEIGRGKFGRVFQCKDPKTGLILAAKVVTAKRKEERKNVEREIEIMRRLQHPRLVQLYDAIEDSFNSEICLVLEMVEGGELFDRVIQDEFVLTERACAVFVRQICEAVEYIHSRSILHLDMKPENVMCLTRGGNRIKIIDFGLARFYDPSKKLQVLFGTPEFVAPEVVNFEEIDYATVITYVLLSGLSPFMGETDAQTMANVTIAKYDFDDDAFDEISEESQDFISKLLLKDKRKRLRASECLKHPWLVPSSTKSLKPKLTALQIPRKDKMGDDLEEDEGIEKDPTSSSSSSECESDTLSLCSPSPPPPSDSQIKSRDILIERPEKDKESIVPLLLGQESRRSLPPPSSSLGLTKEHLREFVNRWTDNPYIFDSPRGIITHICSSSPAPKVNSELPSTISTMSSNNKLTTSTSISSSTTTSSETRSSVNLVSQIRRFSYQFHEEMEIMKSQCSNGASRNTANTALRKCSWSEVSVTQ